MTEVLQVPPVAPGQHLSCDVAVVGGGTAGIMAAITAAERGARVLLVEKAHVRHSGALAMGMDGVNNAVIPGLRLRGQSVRRLPGQQPRRTVRGLRLLVGTDDGRGRKGDRLRPVYHDRPDHPGRDDAEWFWHLNLRRTPDGVPQLVKRAVAPYIVPVNELRPPVREVNEIVLPAGTPGAGPRERSRPRETGGRSPVGRPPRLLELLYTRLSSKIFSLTRDYILDVAIWRRQGGPCRASFMSVGAAIETEAVGVIPRRPASATVRAKTKGLRVYTQTLRDHIRDERSGRISS